MDVRPPLGGSFSAPEDGVDEWRFTDFAIGLAVGLVLAALLFGFWFVTQTREPGLLWGGTVYTSKEEFKGYLKSKGMSYKVWVARHPGAAPWPRS